MVEQSTNYLKFQGSNPVSAGAAEHYRVIWADTEEGIGREY
jgi:hypothetical protein